jgi:putative transposase
LFLEAKWFYNDLLARGEFHDNQYKRTEVLVRKEDNSIEARKIQYLSAQMRQAIVKRTRINTVSLSRLKEKGYRVGVLKFKSRFDSIPLPQFRVTYDIRGNRIKIQKMKQSFRVAGLDQIPKGAELAIGTLDQKNGEYLIHVTTFQPSVEVSRQTAVLGIDFGIRRQLTLSNGLLIKEGVIPTRRLRRFHREFSRRKLGGKNRLKSELKLKKEYCWIANHRRDVRNKIVSRLTSENEVICIQDENIHGWQRVWGRRIQTSAIGGIMSALKKKAHTLVTVPRFAATTRKCSRCGAARELELGDRIYRCGTCDLQMDRDLNAALNIQHAAVPMEHREFTPADMKTTTETMTYLNNIPNVLASLVVEAGSPRPFGHG